MLRRSLLLSILFSCALVWAQGAPTAEGKSGTPPPKNPPPPRSEPAPNVNESSSRDTIGDISDPDLRFPEEEARAAGDTDSDSGSDVQEMHPYDPHKAEHDVEVGDFLMRRKSYRAAESRYREALQFKPNDALATFRLAVVLEKTGQAEEARERYQEYLKILPRGPQAGDAKKALERLKQKKESPKQASKATSPPAETHP